MFGNFTLLPDLGAYATNGFQVLAAADDPRNGGDGDGWLSEVDEIFPRLRLWIDLNHNGISEPGELKTLTDVGVVAIGISPLESRRHDKYGNEMKFIAPVIIRAASGELIQRWAVDVFLVHQ